MLNEQQALPGPEEQMILREQLRETIRGINTKLTGFEKRALAALAARAQLCGDRERVVQVPPRRWTMRWCGCAENSGGRPERFLTGAIRLSCAKNERERPPPGPAPIYALCSLSESVGYPKVSV